MNPPRVDLQLSGPQAAAIESLRHEFAQVSDPHVEGRVRHPLDEILLIALCSVLSDNDSCTDMEVFAQTQLDWRRSFLTLSNSAPSHDVFRNVLMALQPAALVEILQRWSGELGGGQHLAIDGKALRGTYDGEAGKMSRACHAGLGQRAGHQRRAGDLPGEEQRTGGAAARGVRPLRR